MSQYSPKYIPGLKHERQQLKTDIKIANAMAITVLTTLTLCFVITITRYYRC